MKEKSKIILAPFINLDTSIKRMRIIVLSIILSFLFLLVSVTSVLATSSTEIFERIDSDIQILDDFWYRFDLIADSEVIYFFERELPLIQSRLSESANFYFSASSAEANEELKASLRDISYYTEQLSNDLVFMQSAWAYGDEEAYNIAFNSYNSNIDSYNSTVTGLNNYYGLTDYSWLEWFFWISLIISGFLFLISRGNPILPAEKLRNQFEFALFKSSLWPFAGSAISYFWYLLTPPGGTFYILWWIVGAGYFQFARGLYSYLRYSRPALNLAKQEESAKLEKLIMSNKFRHQNLKEKAKEIERLHPTIKIGE